MHLLIDNCVPRKFARLITGHDVVHARHQDWHELENGELIAAAEAAGFDAMITTDKNLVYQQNIKDRRIAVIIMSPRLVFFESLAPMIGQLTHSLQNLQPGAFLVIHPDET